MVLIKWLKWACPCLTTFNFQLWSLTLMGKPRFVVTVLALLLCLISQEIAATSRSLISREQKLCSSSGHECHVRVTWFRKALEMEDYGDQGDESPPHDDYDYDFYRKHGDIPSPGVGHWGEFWIPPSFSRLYTHTRIYIYIYSS